jgi:predicted nucleotidyltransferase
MKLNHMADDLLGSKSKVRILRLLTRFPEREFTEREIAAIIGMSHNTVNIALRDLRKTNALSFRRIGRANVYLVNKNSALFPFLQNFFESEKNIRVEMVKLIKTATKPFISCILFGSFANETEAKGSDLDLLVITKDKKKAKTTRDKLESTLLKLYSIPLSVVLLTPRELVNKWNAPYMREARKNHLLINGRPLGEIYGKGDKN